MLFLKSVMPKQRVIGSVRIMVVGMAEHGKDEFLKFVLEELPELTFRSTTEEAMEHFMFDALKHQFGYSTIEDAVADKGTKRPLLKGLFQLYCFHDKAAFIKHVFRKYNFYCGVRDHEELAKAQADEIVDITVFINASKRKPPEPIESFNLRHEQFDIEIDNNGTIEDLRQEAKVFADYIRAAYI